MCSCLAKHRILGCARNKALLQSTQRKLCILHITQQEAMWSKSNALCIVLKLGILERPISMFFYNKLAISLIRNIINSKRGK